MENTLITTIVKRAVGWCDVIDTEEKFVTDNSSSIQLAIICSISIELHLVSVAILHLSNPYLSVL